MSAQNQEISHVVQEMKGMKADTSDFSHVADELRDIQRGDPANWNKNLAQINSSVDMKALGFPDNFKIDGVTNSGDVITTSGDNKNVQVRDRTHLDVQSETPNKVNAQQWGNRTFQENPTDQSATYNVKKGDTLSSIASDILKQRNGGQTPSGHDVYNEYKALAQLNNIHNANQIRPGQTLKVPGDTTATGQGDLPRYAPTASSDAPGMVSNGDTVNPLAAPGMGSESPDAPADPNLVSRNIDSRDHEDGQTTTKYSGSVKDTNWNQGDTSFNGERTVDQNGHLVHSDVHYGNHMFGANGTQMTISDGKGGTKNIQATEVETTFNSASGKYESTITADDGSKYREVTDANGKALGLKQTAQAPDDPMLDGMLYTGYVAD